MISNAKIAIQKLRRDLVNAKTSIHQGLCRARLA